MSCDIFLHVEILVNGKWEYYGEAKTPQIYKIFGIMAGVRHKTPMQISESKGLPLDITVTTKIHYNDRKDSYHNMSWFNSEEILKLNDIINEEYHYDFEYDFLKLFLFGNSFKGFKTKIDAYPPELQDFRFIFWFFG